MRLTDIRVQSLKPPEKGQRTYRCDSLPGFACRVSQGGTKTFVLVVGRDRQFLTLGRYPIIGLADARAEAKRILAERTLGRHQPPKTTLGAALDLFTEQHTAQLAPRTQRELERLFKRYLTRLRTKKLADVTTHDLTDITDKAAPSEAEHLHRAAKTFFRWCVRRRLLQHSPLEGLELPSKWKPRDRILNDDELRAVWRAADQIGYPFGSMIKLLTLTGQRRGEIAALRAEWIDCEVRAREDVIDVAIGRVSSPSSQCTITLPANITKNKRSHTFPIGELAASLLSTSPCSNGIMFPARGMLSKPFNGWSKAKAQLDKKVSSIIAKNEPTRSASVQPWTLHDLRRTYATNLQRLGVKLEVIEALLNHVSGTRAGIVGVYQRHAYEAEMREAVQTYEEWFRRDIIHE